MAEERLVRERAGLYRTPDERFEVDKDGSSWWVRDTEQRNEFGLPLVLGPFRTLSLARSELADARQRKLVTLRRPKKGTEARTRSDARHDGKGSRAEEREPERDWVERLLPPDRQEEARRAVRALRRIGVDEADSLVERDELGLLPVIVPTLVRERVARDAVEPWRDAGAVTRALADARVEPDDLGEFAALVARRTAERVLAVIDAGRFSERTARYLPDWQLVESERERRVRLSD